MHWWQRRDHPRVRANRTPSASKWPWCSEIAVLTRTAAEHLDRHRGEDRGEPRARLADSPRSGDRIEDRDRDGDLGHEHRRVEDQASDAETRPRKISDPGDAPTTYAARSAGGDSTNRPITNGIVLNETV